MGRQSYLFGHFGIDTQSRILMRDEQRVGIPPKTADLLLALLERGGDLVRKEELMTLLWPDTIVEDNNLAKHIFLLRRTLGQNEQGSPYIETVPKRGYRFVGQVERERIGGVAIVEYEDHAREQIVIEETANAPSSRIRWLAAVAVLLLICGSTTLYLSGRSQGTSQWKSVLVLPFTVSGDTDPLLGSAFAQEVAARLRTIKSLRVVSPLSAEHGQDINNRLSVETILTGRLDITAGGLRVAAQLQSAQDGTVLWAEDATDLNTGDLQASRARMTSSIAARLCGRLLAGERVRLERRGTTNAEAYQAFLHGRAEMLRNSEDLEHAPLRAMGHFETAVRLDPGFADAWAGLARARQAQFLEGNVDRSQLAVAIQNANRALSIDPENVIARHALVRIYHSTGQYEDMLREARRALEINAADPDAQAAAALAYFRSAMLDRAMDLYEKYLAAYPDDEDASYQLVHACLFAKAYDRGIRHAQPMVAVQRLMFPTYLLYANSGDFTHAVSLARQGIASGQGGPAPSYFAPLVLHSAGLPTEARAAWVRASERMEARLGHADNDRTRIFLGLIKARLGEDQPAREQVQRALALSPGDPWVFFFASELYAVLNDRSAALDSLRKSVASGFLGLHYLDYYQQPPNGWYTYRHDPEFSAIRAGLGRKIAELRTRY
jgi:DNA-binding winged helix-turn-helix (wHTH) protein/tetratricopeptide (TPR) repeat protein